MQGEDFETRRILFCGVMKQFHLLAVVLNRVLLMGGVDKQVALESGMNAHIAKPIDEEQVLSVIAEVTGR